MKKAIFIKLTLCILILFFFLFGCAHYINEVENKWGPPHKVENRGDTTVYYYYSPGGRVVEFITDRNGKIINKRRYYRAPKSQSQ
jgi:hypothetical protein